MKSVFYVDFSDFSESEIIQIVHNTAEEWGVVISQLVIANNENLAFDATSSPKRLHGFTREIADMGIWVIRDGAEVPFSATVEDYGWEE